MFTNLNLADVETCHKLFKKEVLDSINITENRFGIENELIAKVACLRVRIYKVRVSYPKF